MAHAVGPDGFLRQLDVQVSRRGHLDDAPDVSVPTIVVSGSDDEVCPTEIQAELAGAIPGARHVTIDGAGHMAPLDHPADVARALAAWWDVLIAHERSSIA
jgi:pimeloyl-ACP methyl ester carboxylesterase